MRSSSEIVNASQMPLNQFGGEVQKVNESLISKITDEAARKVIYHQHLQIESLKLRLDKLEQRETPKQAIGFHAKGSESSPELAFKSYRKYSGALD